MPDPRRDQGQRHPLAFDLSMALCHVGHSAESTVRRALQRIDGDMLDTAIGSRLARREHAAAKEAQDSDWPLPCLAVGGKILPVVPMAPKSTCSPR
ncbi:hypothetical protein SRB17_49250 [Streptomyces sp. RB17]|uniref:transposase family protein n=1 Tax=Streptomyces sp. RB17 TaxID=2585197 RepID=UPI00130BE4A5|nr:transposase family protein [Streptomyces sp. RB17]MQY36923.1 hypothetical protein [Streptomyces sp. RB17]